MRLSRILGAAAFAGLCSVAAPAAAQPYDPYDPYPYQSPGEQVLQGVIDSLLGNRYNVTDRRAVSRCSDAALAEAWDEFGPRRWRGRGGKNNRDGRDWRNQRMQVTAITDVERRPSGLRVRGLIDSGLLYATRRGMRGGDLRFRCNIDYNGRIYNVRVDRNPDFRPW